MFNTLLSDFRFVICQVVAYGNFPSFSSKSDRGRLQEVFAYNSFQISWFELETFGFWNSSYSTEERWWQPGFGLYSGVYEWIIFTWINE